MHVTGLFIYPIKSCAGIEVPTAQITATGFEHDRSWMVVNKAARFASQRTHPKMCLIQPSLMLDGTLEISAPGMPNIQVRSTDGGKLMDVKVWDDWVSATDQGDDVAAWFSKFLTDEGMRLVYFGASANRPADGGDQFYTKNLPQKDFKVQFPDGYPYLVVSQASIDKLNEDLKKSAKPGEYQPIPMKRFRPNIVVAPSAPHEEDEWDDVKIGGIIFNFVKACDRCQIPTLDPETAVYMEDGNTGNPNHYLTKSRKFGRGVMFGQNAVSLQTAGCVSVNDTVTIISRRTPEQQAEDKARKPRPPVDRSLTWLTLAAVTFIAITLHIRSKN